MRLLCNNLSGWAHKWTLVRPVQSMSDGAVISYRVPCLQSQQQKPVLIRGLATLNSKTICQRNQTNSAHRLFSSYTKSSFSIFATNSRSNQILFPHSVLHSKCDFAKRFFRYILKNNLLTCKLLDFFVEFLNCCHKLLSS